MNRAKQKSIRPYPSESISERTPFFVYSWRMAVLYRYILLYLLFVFFPAVTQLGANNVSVRTFMLMTMMKDPVLQKLR